MTTPSKQHLKFINVASIIRLDPDNTEAAFLARQLVQATLPHKDPGNVPAWSRTNGNLILGIQPAFDHKSNRSIGYPYGTIPRLLLFWITTEALRTNNPRLELGDTLATFMRELGLDPSRGGKRSDAKRLREQMERLFRAKISFDYVDEKNKRWLDMQVAPKGMFWWDAKQPNQPTLWNSWIQLSQDFFEAITAAPVPVDMRALRALKRSPLALDLYTWATYTAYQARKKEQSRSVSWTSLHKQFGTDYGRVDDFRTKAWASLLKIQAVYPDLGIERERGGVRILPCNPAVTIKTARRKKPVD